MDCSGACTIRGIRWPILLLAACSWCKISTPIKFGGFFLLRIVDSINQEIELDLCVYAKTNACITMHCVNIAYYFC